MERELSFRALSETFHHLFDPAKVNQWPMKQDFVSDAASYKEMTFFLAVSFFPIQLRPKRIF